MDTNRALNQTFPKSRVKHNPQNLIVLNNILNNRHHKPYHVTVEFLSPWRLQVPELHVPGASGADVPRPGSGMRSSAWLYTHLT